VSNRPSPLESITAAQELIRDPDHWIQGSFAQTENDIGVTPDHPAATCWCIWGALLKVEAEEEAYEILDLAIRDVAPDSIREIAYFNDNHSHEDVMKMFDRAKELAAA
jgi:hypothetical protein